MVDRFPSKQELFLVFSACVFPIHFWISLVLLYKFPSLILKANIWQILGVFAYVFVFTLIESVCLFGFLLLISLILPNRFLRDRFVYRGAALAISIALFAFIINIWILLESEWILTFLAVLFLFTLIYILRRPKESTLMNTFAERLTVISALFIFTDMLSLFYIMLRQFI
jgi:hypothetical protein